MKTAVKQIDKIYAKAKIYSDRMSRDTFIAMVKAYRNTRNPISELYNMMDIMEVQVLDAMIAAHLTGFLEATLRAARHLQMLGPYDGATNYAKKRLELAKKDVDVLRKQYGVTAVNMTGKMGEAIEKKTQKAMAEIIEQNMHIQAGMEHLRKKLKGAISPWTLETVVRTQIQVAYGAGRWDANMAPEIQEILWGYEYMSVGDFRVRPEHEALEGVRLPKEDPQWLEIWPPNGYNCRCEAIEIFKDEKARAKIKGIPKPKIIKGKLIVPGPDQGWAINHGTIFNSNILKTKTEISKIIAQGVNKGDIMYVTDKYGKTHEVIMQWSGSGPPTPSNLAKWHKQFEAIEKKPAWMKKIDGLVAEGKTPNWSSKFWSPKRAEYFEFASKSSTTKIIPPTVPKVSPTVPKGKRIKITPSLQREMLLSNIDPDYLDEIEQAYAEMRKMFPSFGPERIQIRLGNLRDTVWASNRGNAFETTITLNKKYFGRERIYDIKKSLTACHKTGYHNAGDIRSIIQHEFGHTYYRTLGYLDRVTIDNFYLDHGKKVINQMVSKYGSKNSHEMFSEMFVHWVRGIKNPMTDDLFSQLAVVIEPKKIKYIKAVKLKTAASKYKTALPKKLVGSPINSNGKIMTAEQRIELRKWTGKGHKNIVKAQLGKLEKSHFAKLDDSVSIKTFLDKAEKIKEGLLTMEGYQGTTYRGLGFDHKSDFLEFMKRFKIGKNVKLKVLSSSSKAPGVAQAFSYGSWQGVVLKIKGISGRDISKLSNHLEKEILFMKGSRFKVVKIQHFGTKPWITLEEIPQQALQVDAIKIKSSGMIKLKPKVAVKKYPHEEWLNTLSKNQKKAIDNYVKNDYVGINLAQRKILDGTHIHKSLMDADELRFIREGNRIKRTLKNAPALSEKVELYRGVKFSEGKVDWKFINNLQEGKTFTSKQFLSTSQNRAIADKFAGLKNEGQNIGVRIKFVKPKTAIDISQLSPHLGEQEALFNVGTRFKISKVSRKVVSGTTNTGAKYKNVIYDVIVKEAPKKLHVDASGAMPKWMKTIDGIVARGKKPNWKAPFWNNPAKKKYWSSLTHKKPGIVKIKPKVVKVIKVPKFEKTLVQEITAKANGLKLKPGQRKAIRQYGKEKVVYDIVQAQLGKKLAPAVRAQALETAEKIRQGLMTMKGTTATTYRGVKFRTRKEAQDFVKKFRAGKPFKFKALQSSSLNKETAEGFAFDMNNKFGVVIKIKGKTGRDIRKLAHYKGEEEILFMKGSTFKATKIYGNKKLLSPPSYSSERAKVCYINIREIIAKPSKIKVGKKPGLIKVKARKVIQAPKEEKPLALIKGNGKKITAKDKSLMTDWMMEANYDAVEAQLGNWTGGSFFDTQKQALAFSKKLEKSLLKIDGHRGTTYRGLYWSSDERKVSLEYLARFKPGKTVRFKALQATSKDVETAKSFTGSQGKIKVLLEIKGKTGRDVSKFMSEAEDEVIFLKGSRFKVLAKTKKGGMTRITLKEIVTKPKMQVDASGAMPSWMRQIDAIVARGKKPNWKSKFWDNPARKAYWESLTGKKPGIIKVVPKIDSNTVLVKKLPPAVRVPFKPVGSPINSNGKTIRTSHRKALADYTSQGYRKMVKAQLGGKFNTIDEARIALGKAEEVKQGLLTMSGKNVTSYRGLAFGDVKFKSYMKQFEVGKNISFKSLQSTSERYHTAAGFSRARKNSVILKIKGVSGRDITRYSAQSNEKEILFMKGSRFKIVKIEKVVDPKREYQIITLKEITKEAVVPEIVKTKEVLTIVKAKKAPGWMKQIDAIVARNKTPNWKSSFWKNPERKKYWESLTGKVSLEGI